MFHHGIDRNISTCGLISAVLFSMENLIRRIDETKRHLVTLVLDIQTHFSAEVPVEFLQRRLSRQIPTLKNSH